MKNWHCYFHEGPCKLLKEKNGVQLEQHGNSSFRWWTVYNRDDFKSVDFWRKREAIEHFEKLCVGDQGKT